jgi:hypothetical protein
MNRQPVESTIGGMRSRDLPPNRSLDDSRDLPSSVDGRARSPAELLDNLRLRLSQLPENHPSSFREADDTRDESTETDVDSAGSEPELARDSAQRSRQAWPERNDSLGDERWSDLPASEDSMSPQGSAGESCGSADAGVEVGVGTSQDDGPAPGGGSLADLIRAIRDTGDSLAESIGEGVLGDIGTLPGGIGGIHSEPYRPWFMSGDHGVPWFAAGDTH